MSKPGREDAAQGLRWLADARQLVNALSALRHERGQDARTAALELVPALALAVDLAEQAGPDRSEAGFLAAAAAHAAAVELTRVSEAGAGADVWSVGHAGWLIGRAHGLAQAKVSKARSQVGRQPGSGDVTRPHIEKRLRLQPRPSDAEIARQLQHIDPELTISWVGKVRRAMDKDGAK